MTLSAGMYDVPNDHVVAVVTYLEMTAPTAISDRPLPAGFSVAQERPDNTAYRALFRSIGAPWLWTSRLTLPDDALTDILSTPQTELWVVRQAGEPIGLIELDFSVTGICELAFFGIVAAATGNGLGGPMMAHAQSRAFRGQIRKFTVHTCSLDDPRALGFYRKAGFTPVKRSVEVFPDPRVDGPYPPHTAPQIPRLS